MTFAETGQPFAPDSTETSPLCERRSGARVQTVFRVARVITSVDEGLARIRNMSDLGARLRILIPLPMPETLILQLADGIEFHAQVVWKVGDEFGLQFGQPINCADVLANLATGLQSGSTRPIRLSVAGTALICSERGVRSARVVDISQRGLKLVHDGSLNEGLHLKVTLPSGLDRRGIVRWTKDGMAGIMLLELLSVEALGSAQSLIRPSAPTTWCSEVAGKSPKS